MSADNEIAIVRFPNGEIRVAVIHGCPSAGDDRFISGYKQEFAVNCFTDEDEADKHACVLYAAEKAWTGYVEYGTNMYTAKKNFDEY